MCLFLTTLCSTSNLWSSANRAGEHTGCAEVWKTKRNTLVWRRWYYMRSWFIPKVMIYSAGLALVPGVTTHCWCSAVRLQWTEARWMTEYWSDFLMGTKWLLVDEQFLLAMVAKQRISSVLLLDLAQLPGDKPNKKPPQHTMRLLNGIMRTNRYC